jgi:hypothetical protein
MIDNSGFHGWCDSDTGMHPAKIVIAKYKASIA